MCAAVLATVGAALPTMLSNPGATRVWYYEQWLYRLRVRVSAHGTTGNLPVGEVFYQQRYERHPIMPVKQPNSMIKALPVFYQNNSPPSLTHSWAMASGKEDP
eukprot:1852226-Pyramimonas_sp.AAC.1